MAKLYIVGIGSGKREDLTIRALECIDASKVIVGYTHYIKLIEDLLTGKEVYQTPMKSEVERCRAAIKYVREGLDTAIVSSGDPGLYGMAGLILELDSSIDIEVVPGISAAFLAAASLGAPLMHDFCTISLSDLLTPWEVIEKRLESAALGDFVIALYNPKSHSRVTNMERAIEIISKYRSPKTPVGIVKNARRDGEVKTITTLENINYDDIDMLTTVIIGNSNTFIKDGYIITPRGYNI
ncbi:Cobalt-precorrin-3B C(17)-methyltransferase [Caloramator mitchellensis]|uniref:Cobalt-precorrin-3B C(17)-methyltransferase n=1 Tax=Caloramator mitchellensis TaxID=908809 RepID=A0A0R3JR57_CALMK|nr:precorrin-3B C(17)-methyltransferase [Caloramator mitchellensis]KRQ85912.1 Cobalt-precorrin-3B C(17)-methyltransferase [Caloramator mitchellensis]